MFWKIFFGVWIGVLAAVGVGVAMAKIAIFLDGVLGFPWGFIIVAGAHAGLAAALVARVASR